MRCSKNLATAGPIPTLQPRSNEDCAKGPDRLTLVPKVEKYHRIDDGKRETPLPLGGLVAPKEDRLAKDCLQVFGESPSPPVSQILVGN